MITLRSRIKKTPDCIESTLDQEAVILGVEEGKYFGINDIGTIIWQKLEQEVLVSDLTDDLIRSYDEDPETIQAEILDFLNELYTRKLILILDEA